jgi:indolepyruvate decarboxylase
MTGQELSTIVRNGFSPIVIVLDNHGYGTERVLHAGNWKYNEIHPWNYSLLPAVYGGGKGYLVRTEGEFEKALMEAWDDRSQMHLLQVKLPDNDGSETLMRLAARLGKRIERGDTSAN